MFKNYFFVLLVLVLFPLQAQKPEIRFRQISVQQGLSDPSIYCTLQDRQGFIWIGGSNGLYRYDGYRFISYKEFSDPDCISIEAVCSLLEDAHGLLWILCAKGLVVFDPAGERSRLVYPSPSGRPPAGYQDHLNMVVDREGHIWVPYRHELLEVSYRFEGSGAELREGLFGPGSRELFEFSRRTVDPGAEESGNYITSLFADRAGKLLVGCREGLYARTEGNDHFVRLDPPAGEQTLREVVGLARTGAETYLVAGKKGLSMMSEAGGAISHHALPDKQVAMSMLVDRAGNCLLGTKHHIYLLDTLQEGELQFTVLKADSPGIRHLYEDRQGMIWAARDDGLWLFSMDAPIFTSCREVVKAYFKDSDVSAIRGDETGHLWVAGRPGQLSCICREDGRVLEYDLAGQGKRVVCMTETRPGIYWLGCSRGVLEFDTRNGFSRDPLPGGAEADLLRTSPVRDISCKGSRVYMASEDGLFIYDLRQQRLSRHLPPGPEQGFEEGCTIGAVMKSAGGEILLSTSTRGIFRLSHDEAYARLQWEEVVDPDSLLEQGIRLSQQHSLYEDSRGKLWVTHNLGVHSIDCATSEIIAWPLPVQQLFPEARSITEDQQGIMWIGSRYGLFRLDTRDGSIRAFDESDGLPFNTHGLNVVFRETDGRLLFGGTGGFYGFYPGQLPGTLSPPPLAITGLWIYHGAQGNKGTWLPLDQNISHLGSLELPHNQNILSLEFAALDYRRPDKNQYVYRLGGYQDEWMESDARNRVATFTRLAPGRYTFQVRASNSEGIWNKEGIALPIRIRRPWWGSALALLSYLVVLAALIGLFIRWRLLRLQNEKKELERQVSIRTRQIESQNQRIREEEQLKSRFFTNISHEFRTPLTLIQSPVEEMLKNPRRPAAERRGLLRIQRSTRELLRLVNQLLDLSRIDNSRMKLELSEGDLMAFLGGLGSSFVSLAEKKSILYRIEADGEGEACYFDADKMVKVVTNLLTNAFKFSPEGGKISLRARYGRTETGEIDRLDLEVVDSGIGVPEEKQERIFDRFYMVAEAESQDIMGSGIGLALVRDLVHLQHGRVELHSQVGRGSTFSIHLPLGLAHLEKSEYSLSTHTLHMDFPDYMGRDHGDEKKAGPGEGDAGISQETGGAREDYAEAPEVPGGNKKPLVLVVDDNRDLRAQLRDSLHELYRIEEAVDGKAGLARALETGPELVLTDLMMPQMDGLELCQELKSREESSHIPIILLTAKDTLEDRIVGLETGADDYIAKPFHMDELRSRIANLIAQREHLRERFAREITLEPSEITVNSRDEAFLNRALEVVESHLKEEDFGLQDFRQEMHMSRSNLARKLQALTGQSPTEFIRTIRLKRAAQLLGQDFGNVTQVAMEVGFNNISYFNRSFKACFGVAPGLYQKSGKS
jgi:signal transduction histidine kinase/DNA-binding response OmpR family regulator/ligand-binding sensor domain-containing protein